MLFALLATMGLAQDCSENGLVMIREGTNALWEAYARVDIKAFDAASAVIRDGVGCVDSRLEVHTVVELHRTMAIIAFAAGQRSPAKKSFLAARTLDPTWELPTDVYPENHPLRAIFDEAKPTESALEKLDATQANWLVDGLPSATVPLDRAFVLQALDDDGNVRYTGYLWSIIDIPNLHLYEDTGLHTAVLRVSAATTAGILAAKQSTGEVAGFNDRSDLAPILGGELRARIDPLRFAGVDLRATGLLNADAAAGGGLGSEVMASLWLGWETRTDDRRIRFGLRPGIGYESVRAWSGTVDAPVTAVFALPTFALGGEVRVSTQKDSWDAVIDPTFQFTGSPWQLRIEGGWTRSITESVALEGGLSLAPSLGPYSVQDSSGLTLASRHDTGVRGTFGVVIFR